LDPRNEAFLDELVTRAKERIPSVDEIIEETWGNLRPSEEQVRQKFGKVLQEFDRTATTVFKRHEHNALVTLSSGWLENQRPTIRKRLQRIAMAQGWNEFIDRASRLFAEFAEAVQRLEKHLGNMRKARGGSNFQKGVVKLLRFIGIMCETPRGEYKEKLRRVDIAVPSAQVAWKTPDRAVCLTCKRTLRERWKQEVPQVRLNQRVYLVTIDADLTEAKADEINEKQLIAFVPAELQNRDELRDKPWIRSLDELPEHLAEYADD